MGAAAPSLKMVAHGELLKVSPGNASSRHPLAASHDGGFCDDRRSQATMEVSVMTGEARVPQSFGGWGHSPISSAINPSLGRSGKG